MSLSASKAERPRVALIVPTRNSARTLGACLRSIAHQTYENTEAIVVDNHSSDETLRIAGDYAVTFITAGPERSAQRNHGARISGGEFLLFADSDMVLAPGVVEECVAAAQAGWSATIIPEVSFGEGFWARCKRLERQCYVGDDDIEAARFFARELFFAVGGYDERLSAGEDWDLSRRARLAGARIGRIAAVIHHDEGRLRLGELVTKKFHYGKSLPLYRARHKELGRRQFRLVRPAFIRNRRLLLRDPVALAGIIAMKGLEFSAGTLGAATALMARRRALRSSTRIVHD